MELTRPWKCLNQGRVGSEVPGATIRSSLALDRSISRCVSSRIAFSNTRMVSKGLVRQRPAFSHLQIFNPIYRFGHPVHDGEQT